MKILKSIFLLPLSLFATPVFAEDPKKLSELFNADGPFDRVLGFIFPLAGLVCVVFIIIGGYMWMSSAGDPAKVKMAQGTLTWSIIGLILILLLVAVLSVFVGFLVK